MRAPSYLIATCLLMMTTSAGAQSQAASGSGLVTLVSTVKKSFADEKAFPASAGATVDKAANKITLKAGESSLTALAGPEDNMMSFKIEGLTNPEIVVPRGSKVTLTVVNIDDDMTHNLKVTTTAPPYAVVPALGGASVGTITLSAHADDKPFNAAQLVIQASQAGQGFYLCSVREHASKGMFGKLTIAP